MAACSTPRIRSYIANGTINPYCFVKYDTSTPDKNPKVIACSAGDKPIGIAQNKSAVSSGSEVEVALPGGGALLKLGGTVALNESIKATTGAVGLKTASAGDRYGAFACEKGISGDIIAVEVVVGEKYNADAT